MQQPYKIPLHHCQWCYKAVGRFIIDCLCITCEACYSKKNSWIDQNSKCFYCEKPTQRKFIDLKANPQQGGIYFQNINNSMKNIMKVQEFQSQVSRKYCKHLQKKVFKLQTVIKNFIKQFPQYQPLFQNMMAQIDRKQKQGIRSKSVNQSDSQSNQGFGKMLFHNNTEKNIQRNNQQIRSNSKTAYFRPQNKIKNNPSSEKNSVNSRQFEDYASKKNKNLHFADKKQHESGRGEYLHNNNLKFVNQNKTKDHGFQQPYNAESIRSNQSNTFINMGKKEVPIEIYQLGGNNKFSDPTKKPVNLNNINMQTALRSIKSEDGRDDILPFYQHNHMEQKRNNKREQTMSNHNLESPSITRKMNADQFVFHRKRGPN